MDISLRCQTIINNASPNYKKIGWDCPICREHHRIPINKNRYCQFESDLICPNDKSSATIVNYIMYSN